jgi:predicted DNA-binding transcriptional regulator AlpA
MAPKRRRPSIRLAGSDEIRRMLGGVSRERVYQITTRQGFPLPLATLAMGKVWWLDEVEDWIREHRPDVVEDPES